MKAPSVAFFGGTFDPIHNGHLESAKELKALMGFDRLILVPCGDPYHKAKGLSADQRAHMVDLALQDQPSLEWSDCEIQRIGPTYTVDTLRALREQYGPEAHISWVVGQDTAKSLNKWHNWTELFELANLVIVARPGESWPEMEHWPATIEHNKEAYLAMIQGGVYCVSLTPMAISSTLVRQKALNQQSIDDLVPKPVVNWIQAQGLYQTGC